MTASDFSARRLLAAASVGGCRTIVRPPQTVRSTDVADDKRAALIAPSNPRFTDLGMSFSRPTFIQQRTCDKRRRTSRL
jgi:hypothetical protein